MSTLQKRNALNEILFWFLFNISPNYQNLKYILALYAFGPSLKYSNLNIQPSSFLTIAAQIHIYTNKFLLSVQIFYITENILRKFYIYGSVIKIYFNIYSIPFGPSTYMVGYFIVKSNIIFYRKSKQILILNCKEKDIFGAVNL